MGQVVQSGDPIYADQTTLSSPHHRKNISVIFYIFLVQSNHLVSQIHNTL